MLGKVSIAIEAQMAGFESDMGRANRLLQKETARMAQQAKRMEGEFRAAGKAIGTVIAAGVGVAAAAMGIYIKNSIEAEKVQAQIMSRLKDTAGAAGRSLKQLNEQAKALQSQTIFDDEAIGSAQAMLLTFKQIGGVNFDRATAAALDLSTAMGVDLQGAAKLLGKALADPAAGIGALSKAGIKLGEEQKQLIKEMTKTGDAAGAQKIMLDALESSMGSAAEAARDTLGGAIQALKNSFNELLEGNASDGGLRGARQAVEDLNTTLNDPGVKEGFQSMINGALGALGALAKFAAGTANVAQFLGEELAARTHGPAADDRVRIDDALARKRAKLAAIPVGGSSKPFQSPAMVAKLKRDIAGLEELQRQGEAAPPARSKFTAEYERASLNFNPNGTGTARVPTGAKSGKAPKAGKAELSQEQKDFNDREETYGEILQMTSRYQTDAVIASGNLMAARMELSANDRKSAKALIDDMQFEMKLLGMTNIEREREIALRHLSTEALKKYGAEVAATSDQLYNMREATAFISEIQAGMADMFVDFVSGAKSAKEAFGDFADSLFATALRFVADTAVKAFFDAMKPGGGGRTESGGFDWGGAAMSVFKAFGGGRAMGGPVSGGSFYEVGEKNRPEMFRARGKSYLIPGNDGAVTPMRGGQGAQISNVFHLGAATDPRTQSQIATRSAFETNRALARNR